MRARSRDREEHGSTVMQIRIYSVVLAAVAAGAVDATLPRFDASHWHVVGLLLLMSLVAERRSIQIAPQVELSVSFIPLVLAAVLFGPGSAAVVGAGAILGDLRGPIERLVVLAASRILSGIAAGMAAGAAGVIAGQSLSHFVAASAAAAAAGAGSDFLAGAVTSAIRRGQGPLELWRLVRGSFAVSLLLYTPLTALFAYAYVGSGLLALGFFVIPVLAAHLSHAMHSRQCQLIRELRETNDRLEGANGRLRRVNLSFAAAMVRALDSRDTYTAGHSAAVAVYSRDIARELGLSAGEVELVHLSGLVHDIGKIGLRAEVLQKQAALTDEEWAEMRRHSEIGARILVEVRDYEHVASIVRSHHERWDGAGYPDGLAGEEIPRLARIISVADSYNAMTSDRPYRRGMPPEVAINQLQLGKGTQFDEELVDAFLAVLARESEPYRRGLLADFSLEAMQHEAPSSSADEAGPARLAA
jgi:putative nucleotidyltransferase with HDIG domain